MSISSAESLTNWSSAAEKLCLFQPSSVSAGRVFSILKHSFGEQQQSSLKDYVEATVMSQFTRNSIFYFSLICFVKNFLGIIGKEIE